jgi:hypothetical protein
MAPSPKDKRKKVITLTAKGEKVEAEFKEIFKEVSATVKAGVTPEEEKTVREVLAKIRANVGGEKVNMMFKTFKALMKSLRSYKKDVAWTWFYVIIETFCEIMVPFFMQFLVDAMKLNSDPSSDWATYFASFQTKYGPLDAEYRPRRIHTSAGSYDVYVYGAIMAGLPSLRRRQASGPAIGPPAQLRALAITSGRICIITSKTIPLITSINFRLLRSSPVSRRM